MNRKLLLTIPTIVLLASAVSFAQEQPPLPPPSDGLATEKPVPPEDALRLQPLAGSATTAVMGTAFTYQGQLRKSGAPVNATCDFQFSLFDAASGGAQIGATQTKSGVSVSNGLFTIPDLDFGSGAFNGEARWLAIAVQCPGDSGYTALSPRQALTPAPYALALPGLWTRQNVTSPNLVGGYHGNQVTNGVVAATIGGGGDSVFLNRVTDNYSTVGGGAANQAGNNAGTVVDAPFATVGGGKNNIASGDSTTVGGGQNNVASGSYATVSGGYSNTVTADSSTVGGGAFHTVTGTRATVGGGWQNTASGAYATVGGGGLNNASGSDATVGGGYSNTVSGSYATVGGGHSNTASGSRSTVGGGNSNTAAGDYSFVVGRRAKNTNTTHDGVFLFADSTNADFNSSTANEFAARANGGVRFVSSSGTCSTTGGAWSCTSDRNAKMNFAAVDGREVLSKVAALPIQTWSFKDNAAVRHIGPMAQDFYAAFGLGDGDKTISTIDLDGVALAAIQALHQENKALRAENAALKAEVVALGARLAAIERALRAQGEVKP